MDVQRIAGLQRLNEGKAPAFHEPVALERQIPYRAQDEVVPDVEIRQAAVAATLKLF